MKHKIEFSPIGVIHSPFTKLENMPIQPAGAQGVKGTIELFEPFQDGLQDLDGFSHIILLTYLHMSREFDLKVVPFLDDQLHGIFATRAPRRPNPIGLSIVRLEKIEGRLLTIQNVDLLDGTPLLDIKPYVAAFDPVEESCSGWLENNRRKISSARSDDRFNKKINS